jgi:hypothetical protein
MIKPVIIDQTITYDDRHDAVAAGRWHQFIDAYRARPRSRPGRASEPASPGAPRIMVAVVRRPLASALIPAAWPIGIWSGSQPAPAVH